MISLLLCRNIPHVVCLYKPLPSYLTNTLHLLSSQSYFISWQDKLFQIFLHIRITRILIPSWEYFVIISYSFFLLSYSSISEIRRSCNSPSAASTRYFLSLDHPLEIRVVFIQSLLFAISISINLTYFFAFFLCVLLVNLQHLISTLFHLPLY